MLLDQRSRMSTIPPRWPEFGRFRANLGRIRTTWSIPSQFGPDWADVGSSLDAVGPRLVELGPISTDFSLELVDDDRMSCGAARRFRQGPCTDDAIAPLSKDMCNDAAQGWACVLLERCCGRRATTLIATASADTHPARPQCAHHVSHRMLLRCRWAL